MLDPIIVSWWVLMVIQIWEILLDMLFPSLCFVVQILFAQGPEEISDGEEGNCNMLNISFLTLWWTRCWDIFRRTWNTFHCSYWHQGAKISCHMMCFKLSGAACISSAYQEKSEEDGGEGSQKQPSLQPAVALDMCLALVGFWSVAFWVCCVILPSLFVSIMFDMVRRLLHQNPQGKFWLLLWLMNSLSRSLVEGNQKLNKGPKGHTQLWRKHHAQRLRLRQKQDQSQARPRLKRHPRLKVSNPRQRLNVKPRPSRGQGLQMKVKEICNLRKAVRTMQLENKLWGMVTMMRPQKQRVVRHGVHLNHASAVLCLLYVLLFKCINLIIPLCVHWRFELQASHLVVWVDLEWLFLMLVCQHVGANNIYGMLSLLSVSGLDLQHSLIIYLEQLLIWMIYTDMTWPILVASVASTEGSNMLTGIVCDHIVQMWCHYCDYIVAAT